MARPEGVRIFEGVRNRWQFARHFRKDSKREMTPEGTGVKPEPNESTVVMIEAVRQELAQEQQEG